MDNSKVRQGFIAALLEMDPKKIKKIIINIEMQVKKYNYWDKRILFYMSDALTGRRRFIDFMVSVSLLQRLQRK